MKRSQRKRRISWIDVTFSIAIITLTFAAIYLITQKTKNEALATSGKENVTTVIIVDTIDSSYPGIKIVTETSNDAISPFAIQYPQSVHQDFNDEVTSYIETAKQQYLTTINQQQEVNGKTAGELNISFETVPHDSGIYSFIIKKDRFIDKSNQKKEIHVFHLNPETGNQLTVEQLFNEDPNNLKQLSSIVRNTIYKDPMLQENLDLQNVHIATEELWNNFNNFALTNDHLRFYFQQGAFSADELEPPFAVIPLKEINTMLADEFKLPLDESQMTDHATKTLENEIESTENKEVTNPGSESNTIDPIVDGPKRVALTFDDGPDPKITTQILDILKKYEAPATFFMLGSRVEYYPEIAKLVQVAGHELGNHTWTHPDLRKLSVEKIQSEINQTTAIIEQETGQKVTAFRPPYGAINQTVRSQTSLPVALWDVDTLDWQHHNPTKILEIVKQQTKDGSIILMHDIHQSTADGLDAVLSFLQNEGYVFVTVSEILNK
ncbi:polysaccharide deacetylase family protein [Sporosarcina sp. HYO08]|uniref:polysaccharide deacetylase family protein n=1 Tax=Sporosarcina sp. HYO08 TaxID=1759557 RepID=UPI00079B8B59|nr:polysaccharide deacetylase family protein [Sporosarcina sp. HYO08]KXH87227.1 hypothetical protein AU377_01240 [Sporosarcina sp. HYO08]